MVPTGTLRRTGTRGPVTGGKESLRVFRRTNSVGNGVGHSTGRKKDERRVEKKESDDVGTRQERGGQGSVLVGGQAALKMEADGAETPEGKGEGVCREDKKGKREEWRGCRGEEALRQNTSDGEDGGWEGDEELGWSGW